MAAELITLARDCEAIQIPYGNTITAREGTQLTLVHQLGDAFTVRTDHGYLLRIDVKDAEALGLQAKSAAAPVVASGGPLDEAALWDCLRSCYDPEIPANIVDLGLIYEVKPEVLANGTQRVDVKMTLTAPGCGMGQVLKDDVERKLREQPGISDVTVELVFSPPWDATMMTEAARLQLGMM